jgi:hypothetical protein
VGASASVTTLVGARLDVHVQVQVCVGVCECVCCGGRIYARLLPPEKCKGVDYDDVAAKTAQYSG